MKINRPKPGPMTDKIRLVSERDEKEIATLNAQKELAFAIKDFAANLLRIIAGAGKPALVIHQIGPVIEAHKQLVEITGNTAASEAAINQGLGSLDWYADDPRWKHDTGEIDHAQNEIIRAALRLLAAEFLSQHPQKSQAEASLIAAIERHTTAREELKRAWKDRRR